MKAFLLDLSIIFASIFIILLFGGVKIVNIVFTTTLDFFCVKTDSNISLSMELLRNWGSGVLKMLMATRFLYLRIKL